MLPIENPLLLTSECLGIGEHLTIIAQLINSIHEKSAVEVLEDHLGSIQTYITDIDVNFQEKINSILFVSNEIRQSRDGIHNIFASLDFIRSAAIDENDPSVGPSCAVKIYSEEDTNLDVINKAFGSVMKERDKSRESQACEHACEALVTASYPGTEPQLLVELICIKSSLQFYVGQIYSYIKYQNEDDDVLITLKLALVDIAIALHKHVSIFDGYLTRKEYLTILLREVHDGYNTSSEQRVNLKKQLQSIIESANTYEELESKTLRFYNLLRSQPRGQSGSLRQGSSFALNILVVLMKYCYKLGLVNEDWSFFPIATVGTITEGVESKDTLTKVKLFHNDKDIMLAKAKFDKFVSELKVAENSLNIANDPSALRISG